MNRFAPLANHRLGPAPVLRSTNLLSHAVCQQVHCGEPHHAHAGAHAAQPHASSHVEASHCEQVLANTPVCSSYRPSSPKEEKPLEIQLPEIDLEFLLPANPCTTPVLNFESIHPGEPCIADREDVEPSRVVKCQ